MASVAKRDGRANEDFTGAVSTAAVLVDGAGIPGGEATCRHGVAWYAHRLGGALLGRLSLARDHDLPVLLAEAIEEVTGGHRGVVDFGLADWAEVMAVLTASGPAEIIRRVRRAEARDQVPPDDATIAHCVPD